MGVWGSGNFENDTALDWIWDLKESTDLSVAEAAILDVLNCGDYLDADVGCIGLVAAEVVAALRKKPMNDLPEEVSQWVEICKVVPSDTLVKDCLVAVDKIRNDNISELKKLWEESTAPPLEWHSVLDNLTARLNSS